MIIKAKDIKPKVNAQSDFFSWQLYRWVKRYPYSTTIWEGTYSSISGVDPNNKILYIGDGDSLSDGWIHARGLRNLCLQYQNLTMYAFSPSCDTANWKDISEQWWADYMKKGVCAIHKSAHKWNMDGDIRTCQYCKKTEIRKVEQKVIEVESWNDVDN